MQPNAFARHVFAVAVLLCGIFLTPATQVAAHPRKVDIRGKITALHADGSGTGAVLIEGPKAPDASHDKASVRITPRTCIRNSAGEKVTFASLRVGQRVEATFIGPVAESYPVQAVAGEVRILGAREERLPTAR